MRKLTVRSSIQLLLTVFFILVTFILSYGGVPPNYSDLKLAEKSLPQHDWDWRKCYVDSKRVGKQDPKYLRFADHIEGHGINNVIQESLLTYHLSIANNRTYVFEDYVWSILPFPYVVHDFALRLSRIPIGAIIGGALVGSLSGRNTSISAEYFEYVCRPRETVEVFYEWPNEEIPQSDSIMSFPKGGASATEIFGWWSLRLARSDLLNARCVVVREVRRRIFDWE